MALKKTEFSDEEIPLFEDALIYKRGNYWQMRMWQAKEREYARFSLKTPNQSTVADKIKLHDHVLMAQQLHRSSIFNQQKDKC